MNKAKVEWLIDFKIAQCVHLQLLVNNLIFDEDTKDGIHDLKP